MNFVSGALTVPLLLSIVVQNAPTIQAPLAHRLENTAISHVVVIVQENRTVDNLFNGFPGADTVSSGPTTDGRVVPLKPVDLDNDWDIAHTHGSWVREYAKGRMNGFDEASVRDWSGRPYPGANFAYSYVPSSQVRPYWDMASRYAFSDRTFQSNAGPSFPGHLYLIAGQSAHGADNPNRIPWGCDAPRSETVAFIDPRTGKVVTPGFFPCLDHTQLGTTLADELEVRGLSWRYYAPASHTNFGYVWSAYDAVKWIRFGPDWRRNVISPETSVISDLQRGVLANVTWVIPSAANSDHNGVDTRNGPNWVASVVNAIGNSPYWENTVIFITWDDWGGWYDHVVPPQLDYEGLGFRVPLIAIAQNAKRHYVSHVQYESASIVKYIERTFGLPAMAQADQRAAPLDDLFGPTPVGEARQFRPIRTYPAPRSKIRPPNADPDT